MKKRLFSLFLAMTMLVSLFSGMTVMASAEYGGGSINEMVAVEGSGTESDPYQITNADQLVAFAVGNLYESDDTTKTSIDINEKHFYISQFIDISDKEFTPKYTAKNPFFGSVYFSNYSYIKNETDYGQVSFPVKCYELLMVAAKDATVKGMPANTFGMFVDGNGTPESPYLIETASQLSALSGSESTYYYAQFLQNCNLFNIDGDRVCLDGANIKIVNDIDMEGYNFQGIGLTTTKAINGVQWGGTRAFFTGVFDGNNKTISNITQIRPGGMLTGFFVACKAATVRNLTIDGYTSLHGRSGSPFFARTIEGNSTIENVKMVNCSDYLPENSSYNNYDQYATFALTVADSSVKDSSLAVNRFEFSGQSGLAGAMIAQVRNSTVENVVYTLDPAGINRVYGYYNSTLFHTVLKGNTIKNVTLNIGKYNEQGVLEKAKLTVGGGHTAAVVAFSISPESYLENITVNGNFYLPQTSTNIIRYMTGSINGLTLNGDIYVNNSFATSGGNAFINSAVLKCENGHWNGDVSTNSAGIIKHLTFNGKVYDNSTGAELSNVNYWKPYVNLIDATNNTNVTAVDVTSGMPSLIPQEGYHYVYYFDSECTQVWDGQLPNKQGTYNAIDVYYKVVPNNYTVAFNPGTGIGEKESIETSYDSIITLPNASEFSKDGYFLVGWKIGSDETVYSIGSVVKNLTSTSGATVTLTAVWDAKNRPTEPDIGEKQVVDYSGTEVVVSPIDGYDFAYQDEDGNSVEKPKNAGKYDVIVTSVEDEVTVAGRWVFKEQIVINKIQVPIPKTITELGCSLEYNKSEQVGIVLPDDSAPYTITGTTSSTDAGSFTAIASLKDTTNYEWDKDGNGTIDDQTMKWAIAQKTITMQINDKSSIVDEALESKLDFEITGLLPGDEIDNLFSTENVLMTKADNSVVKDFLIYQDPTKPQYSLNTELYPAKNYRLVVVNGTYHVVKDTSIPVDSDGDGTADTYVKATDDGIAPDIAAGDGIYTDDEGNTYIAVDTDNDGVVDVYVKAADDGTGKDAVANDGIYTDANGNRFMDSNNDNIYTPYTSTPSGSSGRKSNVVVINKEGGSATASSNGTVTITPNKGYEIDKVTVNGKETKVPDNGKLTGIKASDKVVVTFKKVVAFTGNPFVDVAESAYYYDAVLWAAKNGITSGVDATHFAPMNITTRAQMVTFLWRAEGCPEVETTIPFTDVVAGSYYEKAVAWAIANGITKGASKTTFSPDENVTRGQTVAFLARLAGVEDEAEGYVHSFTDVATTDYYNNAVAWAFENAITDGTGENTFAPKDDCLRGQIVTFMYRYFKG